MKEFFKRSFAGKRIGSSFIIIVMLASLLSACSSSNNNSSKSDNSDSAVTDTKTSTALKEVTLKIFIPGDQKAGTEEVTKNLEALTKDRLNAKFEINFVPFGDYQNKLTMLSASGDDYDAAFTADWYGYASMVNKEAFLDITDLAQQYAPNLYKLYEDKDMLSSASVNGRLFALPWTQIKTSKPVFAYRKDIADKYNIHPGDLSTIEGIDEFVTALAKVQTGTTVFDMNIGGGGMKGDIVTLLCPKYEYLDIGFYSLYIDANDPDHKVVPLEQTPMFKEAVQLAKKWYNEGVINKNALSERETNLFESGKVLSQKNVNEKLFEKVNFTDKTAVSAAVEVYPNNKFARDSQMNNAMAINRNAANPERMLMFMDLITTDKDVYDALFYGVKDKTYTLDENGVIGFADGEEPSKPLWQGWMGWGFLRSDFVRPTVSRPQEAIDKELAFAMRDNIVISPIAGFVPDADSLKIELVQRDQIQDEQGKLLLAGIFNGDIDSVISDYIEKQKAAGLDKILADVQKQIDDFTQANN